jgi:adenine-specific DNA-methyltransferase
MFKIQKQQWANDNSLLRMTETDIKIYQQKADIVDKQIDTLVYSLYGLTQEEIKVVEGQ